MAPLHQSPHIPPALRIVGSCHHLDLPCSQGCAPNSEGLVEQRRHRDHAVVDLDHTHTVKAARRLGNKLEVNGVRFAFSVALDLEHCRHVVSLSAAYDRTVSKSARRERERHVRSLLQAAASTGGAGAVLAGVRPAPTSIWITMSRRTTSAVDHARRDGDVWLPQRKTTTPKRPETMRNHAAFELTHRPTRRTRSSARREPRVSRPSATVVRTMVPE